MKSPCMGCEARMVGCHAKCEDYAEFKNRCIAANKAKSAQNKIDNIFKDHVIKIADRAKRR